MKSKFIPLLLFALLINSNCKGQEKIKLKEVEIINHQLDSLLQSSINMMAHDNILGKEDVITLFVEKKGYDNYVNISLCPQNSINYPYRENNLSIIGFCTIKNNDILIIENYDPLLMNHLDKTKDFSFSQRRKSKKGEIPPPPPLSNSLTLEYIIKADGQVIKY